MLKTSRELRIEKMDRLLNRSCKKVHVQKRPYYRKRKVSTLSNSAFAHWRPIVVEKQLHRNVYWNWKCCLKTYGPSLIKLEELVEKLKLLKHKRREELRHLLLKNKNKN